MSRIISLRYQKVGPRASGDHITIYIYIYILCCKNCTKKVGSWHKVEKQFDATDMCKKED